MKITVLTSVEQEKVSAKDLDEVVPQVARALRKLGHQVSVVPVYRDVKQLIDRLSRRKPDLVFNMAEMFGDSVIGDMLVAAVLETQGIRYTGTGPGKLYLSQDKGLSNKLLDYEGILYPRYAVFSQAADFETGGTLRMPLFVKPDALLNGMSGLMIPTVTRVLLSGSEVTRNAAARVRGAVVGSTSGVPGA